MRRSKYRRTTRNTGWFSGRRRMIAVAATVVVFGGIVTVTQVSNAATDRSQRRALAACDNVATPPAAQLSTKTRKGTYTTNNGQVTQHADDGAGDAATAAEVRARCRDWVMNNVGDTQAGGASASAAPSSSADAAGRPGTGNNGQTGGNGQAGNGQAGGNDGGQATAPPPGTGLGILTNSCDDSDLDAHDGFQIGNRCVSTEFGEVGVAANNPSLLITQAPQQVAVGQAFTLTVSTRNLIRDRFLAAGQGGYYVESSVLQNGLVRGHFHTACRMLANTNAAPAPDPVPAFFVATEDGQGSARPDSVNIQVTGMPTAGTAQCASWAGDGSHRVPMSERANQTPAIDVVRIQVTAAGGAGNGGNANGGGRGRGNG
ncbi:MAG TPA: Pecanex-like protein 1 [Actinoplanes sp.]